MSPKPKILITQCLQADFVKPITKYEPLPNLLHVGYAESLRLMGEDPLTGPVQKLIDWAYARSPSELALIHVRDRHDAADPEQAAHLAHFGAHCVGDTAGAAHAFRVPPEHAGRPVTTVESLTLNDFHATNMVAALAPFASSGADVGLVGVWTEAKITYLAYELTTRYPNFTLATCSALTASASLSSHFLALGQLEKLLGVRCFASLGEFFRFLGGEGAPLPELSRSGAGATLKVEYSSEAQVDPASEALIRYLFRDCKELKLKVLDGGFSGNLVLGTDSIDQHGHKQAAHVLKIGPQGLIARERTAFERVEAILGNTAPRIVEFADYGERGAIKYRYAAMGSGDSKSFQKHFMRGASMEKIGRVLTEVFGEQLGRFYAAAQLEPLSLLEYYGFRTGLEERMRELSEKVTGRKLPLRGGTPFRNREIPSLIEFYAEALKAPELSAASPESHYVAYIHGDLNGANIILDAHDNVWIIDFFHTHRGHVLKDLLKLENDLLYIFTDITTEAELEEGLALTDDLLAVEDLGIPPAIDPTRFEHEKIRRAAETLLLLRAFYPALVQTDRDPLQAYVGQLRYAAHTMSFDESNPLQKQWAFYAASLLGDRIADRMRNAYRLRIDWIPLGVAGPGGLGLTILPGRRDRGRELRVDLQEIKGAGVGLVVCLATTTELQHYGVGELLEAYREAGVRVRHLPIPDGKVPSLEAMRALTQELEGEIARGKKVLVHCVGGLGRAGTVASCLLRSLGQAPEAAIRMVREARSQRAIETALQVDFIRAFSKA